MADEIFDQDQDQAERERAYAAEDRRYRVAQAREEQAKSSPSRVSKTVDQALTVAQKAPLPAPARVAVGVVAFAKAHPQLVWLAGGMLMLSALMQSVLVLGSLAFVAFVVTHPLQVLREGGLAAIGWVIELLKYFALPSA